MKHIIIAVLLSALIGPGLGQLYNRDIKKGWFLISLSLILTILFRGALKDAMVNLLPPGIVDLNNEHIIAISQKLFQKHPLPFYMFTILIGTLWLYSIVDAYRGAQRRIKRENKKV